MRPPKPMAGILNAFSQGLLMSPFYFSVCTSFIFLHIDWELELWLMGVIVSVHYFKMNQ